MKIFKREIVKYIFFGGLTTVISFIIYFSLVMRGNGVILSNTISYVVGIIFAFVTNKIYVFKSHNFSTLLIIKQFIKFCFGRFFVYLADTFILSILVYLMFFNAIFSRILLSIFVVIANYLVSKKFAFSSK